MINFRMDDLTPKNSVKVAIIVCLIGAVNYIFERIEDKNHVHN